MKTLATWLMMLASVSPLMAGYPVGYTEGEYTYDGTYWTKGDALYSWTNGTTSYTYRASNGCYYTQPATAGYYTFVKVAPIDLTADGAEELIIKGALRQWDHDAAQLKKITNQNYHLALIDKVGLARPNGIYPYSSSYAGAYAGLYAGAYNIGNYGVVPSNTVYGSAAYTVKQSVVTNDPNFDINQAVLLQSQSSNNALAIGERISTIFHGSVDKAVAGQNEITRLKASFKNDIDKIDADALAFRARMDSLRKTETKVTMTTSGAAQMPVGPTQQVMPKIVDQPQQQPADSPRLLALQKSAETKCISCHGDNKPSGGFAIADLLTKDIAYQRAVFARVRPDAPADKRMPKKADGSAGAPLSWYEAGLFDPDGDNK